MTKNKESIKDNQFPLKSSRNREKVKLRKGK